MMLTNLSKKQKSTLLIEKEFEKTRSNYLRDLAKLRRKYASTLTDLTFQYNEACILQK